MYSPVIYRDQKSMLPNFFSHIDKRRRVQTVFRPRLKKITEFCQTDVAINARSSYWPGSRNMASLGTIRLLHSHFYIPGIYSPLGNSRVLGPSSALPSFFSQGRRCLTYVTIPKCDVAHLSKRNGQPGQNA